MEKVKVFGVLDADQSLLASAEVRKRTMRSNLYPGLLAAAIFWLASCSCSNKKNEPGVQGSMGELVFEAEMAGDIGLRAADSQWDAGDEIGIYMMRSGSNDLLVSNKCFVTKTEGLSPRFSPKTSADKIQIPKDPAVDFVAYYPYKPLVTEGSILLNLADQMDPAKINLMTAENLKAISSAQSLKLSFVHRLAKIVFYVQAENAQDLQDLSVRIQGMPVEATYNVLTNEFDQIGQHVTFAPRIVREAGATRVEAFVLPGVELDNASVVFDMGERRSYTWAIRKGQVYDAGKAFTYKVNLKAAGGVEPAAHPFLELPQVSSIPNTVVITHYTTEQKIQRNYSMLYDRTHRLAHWVAYPLHPSYVGKTGRTDRWDYDPQISLGQQYNLRKGFRGGSYDRGHQLPSGDRTASIEMNVQTFYYSNMTAQFNRLNQGQWAQLEIKIRSWMNALSANDAGNDTLYVVTGAALSIHGKPTIVLTPTEDNSDVNVSIPQYYYKTLAKKDKQGVFQTIAFLIPNQQISSYRDYQITVAELEGYTGFTFFPGIPASAKKVIHAPAWQ